MSIEVTLRPDENYRRDIMRNHVPVIPLLHAVLRDVLGNHIHQSGSYVGADKLRFDFSHFRPMTPEEIRSVERSVNDRILEGLPVTTVEDNLEDAKKSGAHAENVAQIGPFLIIMETGIASGVRRLEAVTGGTALQLMLAYKESFAGMARLLNRPVEEVGEAVGEIYGKYLELQKENKKLRVERYAGAVASIGTEIKLGETILRHHDFGEADLQEMAGWVDHGKGVGYALITAAIGVINGKRVFMISSSGLVTRHMGDLVREVLEEFGGRGGGKSNFAQGSISLDANAVDVFQRLACKLK